MVMASGPHRKGAAHLPTSVALIISLLILQVFAPLNAIEGDLEVPDSSNSNAREGEIWIDGGQAWPQFGRTPGREALTPAHSPNIPTPSGHLASITDPVQNWRHYSAADYGVDTLATPVGDFTGNIDVSGNAVERCGEGRLSVVLIDRRDIGGDMHAFLKIVDGDTSATMWEQDVGSADPVKAGAVILDVDEDGDLEVVIAYDTNGIMSVELWAPDIICDETGWKPGGGHTTERMWRYTHPSLSMGADGPYDGNSVGNHHPTAQPLLADLELDGTPELVLALFDDANDDPYALALPLPMSGTPSPLWEVQLSKGTHASDPAWVQLDSVNTAVMLTTIDYDSGSMWVWRLSGASGSPEWGGASLNNLDGGTDAPHVRLPGPVITQLDSDSAMEMIVTIPTDLGGSTTADGAQYIGMEVTNASQLFSFNAVNGYADAPPTPVDTDDDGVTDRVCWVTWYATTFDRHGIAGCHRIDTPNPMEIWHRDLERSSGNPNDEIAVSPVALLDIDGTGAPEVLVAYGRTLHAFDGEEGSAAAINNNWIGGIDLDHRTWSALTLADIDGDGAIDILIGDQLISQAAADVRPFTDSRGIQFSPSTPDPDEEVTVTCYFENVGTANTDVDTFARLYVDGARIHTHREGTMQPISPTGSGNLASFSVSWSGGLGDHEFELRLDEDGNLSQSRTDNDNQTITLTIVAPYNVSIGVPADPVRVDPGGSEMINPQITSTGRLAGDWTMSIDDSNMPDNWTVQDQTAGGSSAVHIEVGQVWTPAILVSAPSTALGSDSGWLLLTMTLDSDTNVTQTGILPIEANRTRGISMRGPDGTSVSTGFGHPVSDASAWLLIENLGNAAETVTRQEWNTTAWGSDLRLYEMDGSQVAAITLAPGEQRELTARLQVPSATAHGNSVSTPLTICIGTGAEEDCRIIQLSFVSNGVTVMPPHIRSVPADDLQWDISIQLPSGVSELEWDLASGGLLNAGWSWDTSGGLDIVGTKLRATGNAGGPVTGTLDLDLPFAAPPMLHQWSMEEANRSGHTLEFSLQVMQVFRAAIEVTSPTVEPMRMNVTEMNIIMLKLENPGNGPDVYDISAVVLSNENFSDDPGLTIVLPSSTYSIGAGSLAIVPIQVTLPEEMPAEQGLNIAFELRSQGDVNVAATATIQVLARQDHQWDLTLNHDGLNLSSGASILVAPGDELILQITAENTGNLIDTLTLTPSDTYALAGGDDGLGWSFTGDSISDIEVDESGTLTVSVTVSDNAWKGTIATVDFQGMSDDISVPGFVLNLELIHVPAWKVLAGGADLDIDRNGENITLEVENRGNWPAEPFITGWVDISGWTVNISTSIGSLDPAQKVSFDCEITPPVGTVSGHSVELNLRARNADGSGASTTTLPLRVAEWHEYTLTGEGQWGISSEGGLPLAMVSNLGNAPTTIELDILGLPANWQLSGPEQVSLAVGESAGIPLSAIPPNDWNGDSVGVTLRTTDGVGTQLELTLTLTQLTRSWASSPVLFGTAGDTLLLTFLPGGAAASVIDGNDQLEAQADGFVWITPNSDSDGVMTVDGESLDYWARVRHAPTRDGSCSIAGIGIEPLATCSILNGTDEIDWTAIMRDETGQVIDQKAGHLSANTSLAINLSGAAWNPDAGTHTIRVTLLDGQGAVIAERSEDMMHRDSDWNLGITAVELISSGDDQQIVVSIVRSNHSKLSNAICQVEFSSTTGSWTATHRVNVVGDLAPQLSIDRPPLAIGETVNAEIGCDTPWDIDGNPDDDQQFIVLTKGATITTNAFDWVVGVVSAVVIFGAMWLAGFVALRPDRPKKQKKRSVRQGGSATSTPAPVETEAEDDSMHIEDDAKPAAGGIDLVEFHDEDMQAAADAADEDYSPTDDFESRLGRLGHRRR